MTNPKLKKTADRGSEEAEKRILGLLGFAARSRGSVIGTGRTRDGVRQGSVRVVVFANDVAMGQRKKLLPLLERREVPFVTAGTREALGRAVGSSPTSAVGVVTPSIAQEILKQYGI